jgi:hypothetical protein
MAPTMLVVPWMAGDIHDVNGLATLAESLRSSNPSD